LLFASALRRSPRHRRCLWPRSTRPWRPTPSASRAAADPAGTAVPMAGAARSITARPAGIPAHSASVASGTGRNLREGGHSPPSLLSGRRPRVHAILQTGEADAPLAMPEQRREPRLAIAAEIDDAAARRGIARGASTTGMANSGFAEGDKFILAEERTFLRKMTLWAIPDAQGRRQ
jgi:hypothetical protein